MYLHAIEDNRHSEEITEFINQLYKRMTCFQDLIKFRHPCYDWMKQKENIYTKWRVPYVLSSNDHWLIMLKFAPVIDFKYKNKSSVHLSPGYLAVPQPPLGC